MPSLVTQTRKQLSELASPDEFEALATAVLREANPDYSSLLHVGTNISGRAVRSPVDGINAYVQPNGRHLLLVQHTITARKGLRQKWLGDVDGDVTKAKAIFNQERLRGAVRGATLVLTGTHDPDEALIRDVHAAAGDDLTIDFWPGSRIADFLDRNPEGQWLREQQFGTSANRVSFSQAHAISQKSLKGYLPLVSRAETVPRMLDKALAEFCKAERGVGFIIGESGLGKSISLRRLSDDWVAQGGIALVLAHELIEKSSAIEHAIAHCLRNWAPDLDLGCGYAALGFANRETPILLIVEDINRSTNPRRIVERLISWSVLDQRESTGGDAIAQPWRLLCPVWRGNAGLSDIGLRDHVLRRSFLIDRFERSEAIEAIRVRASSAGVELTTLQRNDLAVALGDDPLLIGLNQTWSASSPRESIQSYVTANIDDIADEKLLASDYRYALDKLAEQLLTERIIYPGWQQIRMWFSRDSDTLSAMRQLIEQGRIISIGTGDEKLLYRHDRVRDDLLAQATARLIENDRLTDQLWNDPFYVGWIGAALSTLPITAIDKVAACNPAALFFALQETRLDEVRHSKLVEAARGWIASPSFKAESSSQQRHHAMQYLARIDGAFAADLATLFPPSFPRLEALVRNGHAHAGAVLCANSGPDRNDRWRDRIIEHARSRHSNFIPDLAELISDGQLSAEHLEGALNLAGEVGDAKLCNALAARWNFGNRMALTSGWLWAVLRCCPPIHHPLADTLCNLWGEMPTKVKRQNSNSINNPRWDIAGYSLRCGFGRKPESSAIDFLIKRAIGDSRLEHVLNSILINVDLPNAVLYSIKVSAKISRRAERTKGINFFTHNLQRTWSPAQQGHTLSAQSRGAIERVWRDRRINRFERKAAFLVWSQTPTPDELAGLVNLENDSILAEEALRTRLNAGDQSALPLLRQRIWETDSGEYWWHYAQKVGLSGLHKDVGRYFERRSAAPDLAKFLYSDQLISELLMDSRDEFAIRTVIENWEFIKTSPSFVQAALYLATAETVALAQSAISENENPDDMLQHIDMHWGIRTSGRPGVTDIVQLKVLEPYFARMKNMGSRIIIFFEEANRLGELNWREKHIDPIMVKTEFGNYCSSDKQNLFASLDEEVGNFFKRNQTWFHIEFWFERREEELWARDALLKVIFEWAYDRASDVAVKLFCEALQLYGERRDLALLGSLPSSQHKSCADRITNCVYAVRRRSLSSAEEK